MSFGVGFGDILKFVDLATRTYKYGFSKAQGAHTLYHEFGDNIQGLATNLNDLDKIVGYLGQYGTQFLDSSYMESLVSIIGDFGRTIEDCDKFMKDKERFSWEGDFISNIYWNFSIASEVQVLKDRVAFLNIKLMTVLKTLDLRMANQLHIDIFRIHQDLAMRIDNAQETIIQAVQATGDGILDYLRNGSTASALSARAPPGRLDIPLSLEALFEQELEGSSAADPDRFPLIRGLDAVVYHLYTADSVATDSRDMKRERHWLAISKALWIIARVKLGRDYKEACALRASNTFERQMNEMGITVVCYVKCLETELANNVKRSELNSDTPNTELIRRTFKENPLMWLEMKEEAGPTPTWELEYSENIMEASLQGPYRGYDQSLQLFKLTDVDLKLVITDTLKNSTGNTQKTNNIMNVDVRRSRLVPLYAANNGPGGSLNITFQGDRLGSGSSALTFNKRSELFKFQNAITGYQVVFDSLKVGVVTYVAARVLGGRQSEYSGRLQLWRLKRPHNTTANATSPKTGGSSSSTDSASTLLAPVTSSVTVSSGSPPNRNSVFSRSDSISFIAELEDTSESFIAELEDTNESRLVELPGSSPSYFRPPPMSNRNSAQSGPMLAAELRSPPRPARDRRVSQLTTVSGLSAPDSRLARRDSTFTVSSTSTSATAATAISLTETAYTTSVVSADGTVGVILEAPKPSLLVLLIQKSSKRGDVSYATVAVEIDENTAIDPSSCQCRKSPDSCLRVVIQRPGGGTLTSIRQDAGTDLEAWNLAALGYEQRKTLEKEQMGVGKERLAWVAVDLSSLEEKRNFMANFTKLRTLLVKERDAYNRTIARLRN